ncbi:MAG: hypothetical protein SF182_18180 [Deltaproteobacteria bacterium]|nr:hypothetical protein [Deltaproteobacteria bacterium]
MDLTAVEWLQVLLLGGLVGALGQGARVVVGLKKLGDEAAAKGGAAEPLQPSRMVTSLLIGFIAGALTSLTLGVKMNATVSLQQILGVASAGYAGADFIEGFMSRTPLAPATSNAGAAAPAAAGAATAAATSVADGYLG